MSTTGRIGDSPWPARVTVTRLRGTHPVPWIRKTVSGSPMGWSIRICGEPEGAAGNADGGGPGGGNPWAVPPVLGVPCRFGSETPTMTPPATSATAAPARPAVISARWPRRSPARRGAVPGLSPAGCGRPSRRAPRRSGRRAAAGAGSAACEPMVASLAMPSPVLPLVSSPAAPSPVLPLVSSPPPSAGPRAGAAGRGPCWYPLIMAMAGAGR